MAYKLNPFTGNLDRVDAGSSPTPPGIQQWAYVASNSTFIPGTGYICVAPGGALDINLPATSELGDTIAVALLGATSYTIVQAALQQVRIGAVASTAGIGGSVTSTAQGDVLLLVCVVPNLVWLAISSIGNPIIV